MNKDEQQDRFSDLVTARSLDPGMPPPQDVTAQEWAEIGRLAALESALFDHTHGAPPLEEDPVAAMLGLVPDPHLALDGSALARARKKAKLKVSDVARALRGRGWDVTTGDVARWESRAGAALAPTLLQSIATEVGTTPEAITTDRSQGRSAIDEVTRTPAFQSLARRFAAVRGLSQAVAASTLRTRGLATQHRGDAPDPLQWLQTLEAFVTALENRGDPDPPSNKLLR